MYTLGYSFRPWKEAKSIADGPSILDYVRDTAKAHGIDKKIRYGHRVTPCVVVHPRREVDAGRRARRNTRARADHN